MKRSNIRQDTHRPALRVMITSAVVAFLLTLLGSLPLQAQPGTWLWTGGGANNNFSTPANWYCAANPGTAPTTGLNSGVWLAFTNTAGGSSINNDLTGLTIEGIAFASGGWVLNGNPITTSSFGYGNGGRFNFTNASGAGQSNYIGNDMVVQASTSFSAGPIASTSSAIAFGGKLSGAGGFVRPDGSQNQGQMWLLNPNNTISGADVSAYPGNDNEGSGVGPYMGCIASGYCYFASLSMSNQPGAMGQTASTTGYCTNLNVNIMGGSPHLDLGCTWIFGAVNQHEPVACVIVCPTNTTTDLSWMFRQNWGFSPGGCFSNNSPNDANCTFLANATWFLGTDGGTASSAAPFGMWIGGTSTGTNIFEQSFTNYPSVANPWVYLCGPVSAEFCGSWYGLTNTLYVTGSQTNCIFASNIVMCASAITVSSGGRVDATWYDQAGVGASGPFTIGAAPLAYGITTSNNGVLGPQTLNIGHTGIYTGNQPADWIGSLALTNNSAGLSNPGTLNIVGGATNNAYGTFTISNGTGAFGYDNDVTFTPANGAIYMNLNSVTNAGGGTNDLIVVNGNLDLSQGPCTVNIGAKAGTIATGSANQYTLIEYTGALTGNASGLSVQSPNGASYTPGVVSTATPGKVTVCFFPSLCDCPQILDWSGMYGSAFLGAYNWMLGTNTSIAETYAAGDAVQFLDNASSFQVNIPSPIVGQPSGFTVNNNDYDYTIGGPGSIGGCAFYKAGTGSLTMSLAPCSFTSATISAGSVYMTNGFSFGANGAAVPITLGDARTGAEAVSLYMDSTAGVGNITVTTNCGGPVTIGCTGNSQLSAGTILTNITLDNNGVEKFSIGPLAGAGNVTEIGGGTCEALVGLAGLKSRWTVSGAGYGTPTILMLDAGYLSPGVDVYMTTNGLLTSPGGNPASVTVSIGGLWGDSLPGGAGWDGSSAVYPGMVCFNGGNAVQNVTLAAGPTNPAITAYFNGQFTTFNEFSTACTLSYTKIGAGAEVFTQDNSQGGLLNGTNNVNAGILELDNASGSGLPNGPVTINSGGQLQGCGAVGGGVGDFNVNNGGVLAAGTNGETAGNVFTVYGNGTLYLNGTLAVNLWSGAGTGGGDGAPSSDMLLLDLPVVLGSASSLVVGNLNHMGDYAPLDTWTIIDWGFGTPTGIFGSVTLPALPEYMAWDTNDLYTMGQIFVVYAWDAPPPSPATNITYSPANNGTVTITGVNGNGSYSTTLELLSTTQLWQPLTNWTDAATGGYTNGVFTFTVTNVHATPSTYFTTKAMP